MNSSRTASYLTPILVLLGANLVLASSKLWVGMLTASTAMQSDGWNNTADFLYGLLLLAGLYVSVQPPDSSHPEGHQRFESLISGLVSVIIFATGLSVIWDAYGAYFAGTVPSIGRVGVGVLLASMVVKGGVSWYMNRAGKHTGFHSFIAISRDQAGDILADFSVLFAVFASWTDWFWVDPIVAGAIGLLILKIGYDTLKPSLRQLTGHGVEEDFLEQVRDRVDTDPLLGNPVDIRAHYVGPVIHLSLTVKAPPDCLLEEVHRAEERLRESLLELDGVHRVFIHVEPPGVNSPNRPRSSGDPSPVNPAGD